MRKPNVRKVTVKKDNSGTKDNRNIVIEATGKPIQEDSNRYWKWLTLGIREIEVSEADKINNSRIRSEIMAIFSHHNIPGKRRININNSKRRSGNRNNNKQSRK